ncbi:uncharacterized protein LOC144164333 [Haemaphysalis longicornis]
MKAFILLALLGTVVAFEMVAPEADDSVVSSASGVAALRGGKRPWKPALGRPGGNRPPNPGPCKAAFPRFYCDDERGDCFSFIYGGCGGNGNNFKTRRECRRACGGGRGRPNRPPGLGQPRKHA